MEKEKNEKLVELKNIEELNKKKRKIPEEILKLMRKEVFVNILRAIAIFLYFIALNVTFSKLSQNNLINCLEIVSGILLITSLVEFERAYKKDSGIIAISAIELLFLSMHALTIIHICTLAKFDEKIYVLTSSYIFAIYYVLKSIIAYSKMKKQYIKSLNDISDIVKKDEPVKKEAAKRKTTKTKKIVDDEEIKPIKRKSISTKTTVKKSTNATSRTKKVAEDVKTEKKKTTAKPKSARGTKKTITEKKEEELGTKSATKKTANTSKASTSKTAGTKKSTATKKADDTKTSATKKKAGTTKSATTKKANTTKSTTTKKTTGTTTKKRTTTKTKKEVEVND